MATGAKERIATPVLGRGIVIGLISVLAALAAVSVLVLAPFAPGRSLDRPAEVPLASDGLVQHYIAMGEFYTAQAEARQLAEDALVARWAAMGEFYTAQAEDL